MGVLGAGRLGEAIARTWRVRTGQAPLVWNRSGSRSRSGENARVEEVTWVGDWTRLLEARSIVIAVPGKAVLQLAATREQGSKAGSERRSERPSERHSERHSDGASEAAAKFTGNVFCAAASLSQTSLARVFPRATVFCISPFLIDGVNSIPMLVLRPSACAAGKWTEAKAELEMFGEVDVVEDEEIFSQLALLGASWPSVVLAGVQAAAAAGLQGIEDESAARIGNRIFYRAMESLLAARTADRSTAEIATPGGITERGLRSLEDVTRLFESVFKQMQARAAELRA